MRVDARINAERLFCIDGEPFRTTDLHESSAHIIGKHIETLVKGIDIDMVIVRHGCPGLAYRIYNDSLTSKVFLAMDAKVLN